MEKLIELHKKFIVEIKGYSIIYYNVEFKKFCFDCVDSFYDFSEGAISYLISKEYGFIDWLLDNEKINWNYKFYFEDYEGLCGTYECLLMQLAIQDDPIEFLISILK